VHYDQRLGINHAAMGKTVEESLAKSHSFKQDLEMNGLTPLSTTGADEKPTEVNGLLAVPANDVAAHANGIVATTAAPEMTTVQSAAPLSDNVTSTQQ